MSKLMTSLLPIAADRSARLPAGSAAGVFHVPGDCGGDRGPGGHGQAGPGDGAHPVLQLQLAGRGAPGQQQARYAQQGVRRQSGGRRGGGVIEVCF